MNTWKISRNRVQEKSNKESRKVNMPRSSITLEDRGYVYLDFNYKMVDEEGLPLISFSFKTEPDQFNRLKSLLSITKEVYYIEAYQIDTEGVHGRWNVVVMAKIPRH